jgi:hypothetical protein
LTLPLLVFVAVEGCGLESGGMPGNPDGEVPDATVLDAGADTTSDTTVDQTVDAGDDGSMNGDAVAEGGDAASDAGSDAAQDAQSDSSSDSGVADSGSDSGIQYGCDGGLVNDCSQCKGATMPCVYCQTDGGSLLAQHCIPFVNGTHCANTAPGGYQVCPCNNNAQQCPAGFEVCHSGTECRTCGENNTISETCKMGGKCFESDGGCF